MFLRKRQHDAIVSLNRLWIIAGALFGAVVGSRLIGGLEDPGRLAEASNAFLHFYQNSTIVGGLLGGLAGVEAIKQIIGEKRSSGDLFTYPIILAMIIGRVGCFSMGVYEDTFGLPTSILSGMDLGDGTRRHPVTLYEIGFLILIWIVLTQVDKRLTLADGGRFKLFMILYLVFRFILDYIKPHYTFAVGLSTIQLACAGGLLYYSYFIFHPKKIFTAYA